MAEIGTDLYLAYENGYEAGKRDATQKWISVYERLPKYGDYVIGIGPKHGYYISEYRGKAGIQLRPWFVAQGRSVRITHWMPLPEPPKEGGGEDG